MHRTILSLYYFVMRAYNRTDDHSFRSTTRILAKDAYDNAGHKRKKLIGGAVGAVGVVEHGVEAGRSKVSSAIEGGREKVEHIKEKIVEHTPFVGKHKHHKSSDSGHHLSGKMKLGAAVAAGAAAAHLKSRHEKQERRDRHEGDAAYGGEAVAHTKRHERREQHEGHAAHGGDFVSHTRKQERRDQREGHAAHGGEVVVHTKRHERREQHEGHAAHGGDFVSHTRKQERRDQREGHAAHGGEVVVHTKRGRVAEWRDGVNESMTDAPINNRFGKSTGHQSHVVTATGAISDAAFHNQFARPSGHRSHAVNFTGSRNQFEDDILETRMSDSSRTGLVENVDVRARPSGRQSHAVNFTGSRNQFEDDILETRMSDNSRTGLVENVDVRELKDDRIHTGEMTVIEEHRHGRGRGGGLIDSRTHIEKTTIHGGHERGHEKHGSIHSNHHTGTSDSRANLEFEAERRRSHKSGGGHLGGHTDERIVKETRVTKFADNLRTNEALQSPGFLRPGPAPFSETRGEVFHDAPSRAGDSVHGTLGERRVKSQENTWVDNISSAANGGAVKKVAHVEETWDIDDDNSTEIYNFMEEKRKAVPVPGSESKVVTEQKWWNTSSGKSYK